MSVNGPFGLFIVRSALPMRGRTIADSFAGIELLGIGISPQPFLFGSGAVAFGFRHAVLEAVRLGGAFCRGARFSLPRTPQVDDLSHCPSPWRVRARVSLQGV